MQIQLCDKTCPHYANYIHAHTYRVTWIQLQGTKYVEGCVVVLDSSEILPIFGVIINVLKEENGLASETI